MAPLRVFLSRCRGLWFGYLLNGAFGGLRCVVAYYGLTVAWWNILRRLSSLRRGVAA